MAFALFCFVLRKSPLYCIKTHRNQNVAVDDITVLENSNAVFVINMDNGICELCSSTTKAVCIHFGVK